MNQNNIDSLDSDLDLNTLHARFDRNYDEWKSLQPGDPQRQILTKKNERLLSLIISKV